MKEGLFMCSFSFWSDKYFNSLFSNGFVKWLIDGEMSFWECWLSCLYLCTFDSSGFRPLRESKWLCRWRVGFRVYIWVWNKVSNSIAAEDNSCSRILSWEDNCMFIFEPLFFEPRVLYYYPSEFKVLSPRPAVGSSSFLVLLKSFLTQTILYLLFGLRTEPVSPLFIWKSSAVALRLFSRPVEVLHLVFLTAASTNCFWRIEELLPVPLYAVFLFLLR